MAGLFNRAKLALTALLGGVVLCVALAVPAWADNAAQNTATETVRFPDVWCRAVPMTGQVLDHPSSLANMYMDPQDHPVVSYVLRLSKKRSVIRYYDFFEDKVIDEYTSICKSIGKCQTLSGVDSRVKARQIRERHGLRNYGHVFDSNDSQYKHGAYSVPSPKGSRSLSFAEIPTQDGGRMRRTTSVSGLYPLSAGLQKFDADGHELFHVMLVQATKNKRHWHSNTENPYWEGRAQAYIHSSSIYPLVYDLHDGTYLMMGLDWPGLVRFRGALQSPCLENSKEYLVVSAPRGRDLYEEALIAAEELKKTRPSHLPHQYLIDVADEYVTEKFRVLINAKINN